MSKSKYWTRKKDHFAARCEDQEPREDGRIRREWINPQTGEPGETYEYHRNEFDGFVEYVDLAEGMFGWEFRMGIQGSMRVHVLTFKVLDQKGRLVDTLIPVIRKITNLQSDIPLHVGLFTPEGQGKWVKTYTVLKQDDEVLQEGFEKDPDRQYGFLGIPGPVIGEGIGGKKTYDYSDRDKFLFDHLQKFVEARKEEFAKNKERRPKTDAEAQSYEDAVNNMPPEPTPEVEAQAKTDIDDDSIPF